MLLDVFVDGFGEIALHEVRLFHVSKHRSGIVYFLPLVNAGGQRGVIFPLPERISRRHGVAGGARRDVALLDEASAWLLRQGRGGSEGASRNSLSWGMLH